MRLLIIVAAVLLVGCSKTSDDERKARAPAKSITNQLINDMTGKTSIDAGWRAKSTIDRAEVRKRKDLEDVLGK